MEINQTPMQEYTFKILSVNYEIAHFIVEFTPADTQLTKISLNVPINSDFDPANAKQYMDRFAPFDKWNAQKVILQHGDNLVGLEG